MTNDELIAMAKRGERLKTKHSGHYSERLGKSRRGKVRHGLAWHGKAASFMALN